MVNIIFTMIKELFLSIVAKVAFKAVLERFFTRLIIFSLEKLRNYSTNEVVEDTVQDIINQLKGKKLKVVDELGE